MECSKLARWLCTSVIVCIMITQVRLNCKVFFLGQYHTVLVVQLRCQIFRQSIQIEAARVAPLPTKFVTNAGKDASKCAAKASAVNCAVLP